MTAYIPIDTGVGQRLLKMLQAFKHLQKGLEWHMRSKNFLHLRTLSLPRQFFILLAPFGSKKFEILRGAQGGGERAVCEALVAEKYVH